MYIFFTDQDPQVYVCIIVLYSGDDILLRGIHTELSKPHGGADLSGSSGFLSLPWSDGKALEKWIELL